MAYIGNSPGVSSQRIVSEFEPTTDTTSFTPSSGYTVGYVDVYLNGIKLQNGTDFTASNGTSVVLTDAAVSGDLVEIVAYIPRGLSDGYTKTEADARYEPIDTAYTKSESDARYMDINEVIDTAQLRDGAVTAAKIAAGAAVPTQSGHAGKFLTTDGTTASWGVVNTDLVSDTTPQLGGKLDGNGNTIDLSGNTDALTLPQGTTAQEPAASSYTGAIRYDSTLGTVTFSDGTNWYKIAAAVAQLSSVSGTLYAGVASTLVLSGSGFLTSGLVVNFAQASDSIDVDVTVTPSSDVSASVTVPSSVYNNVTAGNSVTITVTNSDGMSSAGVNTTAGALPTGGTIVSSGGYRYHIFTSSGTFSSTNYGALNVDYLIVAGGGSGGINRGGGGGGGGLRVSSVSSLPGASYPVVVGAGGSSSLDGGASSALGISATGGGGENRSGGSGGGGSTASQGGGAGTSGQGYAGGSGGGTGSGGSGCGGGGGGYSGAGQSGSTTTAGTGANGWTITSEWSSLSVFSGMTVLSSGGGGGQPYGGSRRSGGTGAGAGGYGTSTYTVGNGLPGVSYGSGSGGGSYNGGYSDGLGTAALGKQGIVIIRYAL